MRILFLAAPAGLSFFTALLAPQLTAAQTTPDSVATPAATPGAARPGAGTLLKLGTGFTRGLSGGYRGLAVPLVLGAEHHLTPALSLYGNAFSGFKIGERPRYGSATRQSIIGEYGFDVGIKYYYNQEKRRQKGRATGPFVGNYLALQSTSAFSTNEYKPYQYSTLTLLWGMQRRIGKYGWFDAYVGAGLGREPGYTYYDYYAGPIKSASQFGIAAELGIKFSLGKAVK